MKHRLIRAWFDYGNRPSGDQMVPESGEANSPGVESATRGADGPGASPKRQAPALLFQQAAKRAFDIVVATFGLVLLSPIALLASLAIKLDSRGPIVCRQVRRGY